MEGGEETLLHSRASLTKTTKNITIYRILTVLRAGILLCFLRYRVCNPLYDNFLLWLLAGCCEIVFAVNFLVFSILKWRPVERQTYPERLPSKLYGVDIFISTADPHKEPPLITANTILSALALDYNTVSCYISDDAASPITFCMVVEVSKFAQKWVPFCNKFSIEPPAPAQFLSSQPEADSLMESSFSNQCKILKNEFEQMKNRITDLVENPQEALKIARLYTSWPSDSTLSDHPGIVEVIRPSTGHDQRSSIPLLVYVAREKRQGHKHHYKAGAMNALMRVSGALTNNPIILNLDCDMHINDSKVVRRAMCVFMDPNLGKYVAFVQFPQVFHNIVREDVYGNRLVFVYDILLKGLDGIQGPFYCGTGCFHRRAALCGHKPELEAQEADPVIWEDYRSKFSSSPIYIESALNLEGRRDSYVDFCSCSYEQGTTWGKKVGWRYGSSTEDVLTGYHIHCMGWRSVYLWQSRPAFKGIAPTTSSARLAQRKRVAEGLVSILFCKKSPLFPKNPGSGLIFLQRIAYIYICMFYVGVSVFLTVYVILHATCLFKAKSLLPKVTDRESLWVVMSICFEHGMSFVEYRWADARSTVEEWWNEERFWFIANVSSFLLGTLEAFFNSLRSMESVFTVTPKDSNPGQLKHKDNHSEIANFGISNSPVYIPLVTVGMLLPLGMTAAILNVVRKEGIQTLDKMGGEVLFGVWGMVIMHPVLTQILKRRVPRFVLLLSLLVTISLWIMVHFFM